MTAQKEEIASSNEETEAMLNALKADAEAMAQNAIQNGSSSSDSTYVGDDDPSSSSDDSSGGSGSLGGSMAWPVPAWEQVISPLSSDGGHTLFSV